MKLPEQDTKDMLLQAAKACGMTDWLWNESEQCLCRYCVELDLWYSDQHGNTVCWNPLEDDGICACMEAELGINITWYND